MEKILVIQTAFIGDVILATALLESIHQSKPDTEIHLLVKKGNESLFREHPFVKQVHVFDKKSGKLKEIGRLIKTFRKLNFDVAINLHRFFSSGFITVFSGAKKTIGFDKNPMSVFFNEKFPHIIDLKNPSHEIERNFQLISRLGSFKLQKPKLYTHSNEFIENAKLSQYVCFAPASVWFTKQLPKSKWIELGKQINKDTTIYLIGAHSDINLCKEIASHIGENAEILAGKLSLLESAELMKYARMNYVNDSAPLHLCSAVNAPVTAFFCSTVPEFGFGPLSENAQIVQISKKLKCRPCGLHGKKSCPLSHFECGKKIEIQVFGL